MTPPSVFTKLAYLPRVIQTGLTLLTATSSPQWDHFLLCPQRQNGASSHNRWPRLQERTIQLLDHARGFGFSPDPPVNLSAGHFLYYSDSSCWDINSTLRKTATVSSLTPFLVFPARFPLNSQIIHCDQTDRIPSLEVSWVVVRLVSCVLTKSISIKKQKWDGGQINTKEREKRNSNFQK